MGDGVLQEILRLEQLLASELAEERRRAESWLAGKRLAVEQQQQQQRERLQDAALAPQRRRQLRRQAAAELQQGCRRLRQLQRLDDTGLRRVLQEVMAPVFGEGAHDRPDGQG